MDSSFIISLVDIIVCFICLLAWSAFVIVKMYIMDFDKFFYEVPLRGQYRCLTCQKEFDGSVAYALFPSKSKSSKYKDSSVYKKGIFSEPEYINYSKEILCPYCNKKQWVLVENINEINASELVHKVTLSKVLSRLIIYLIGATIIIIVGFMLPQMFI